MARDDLPCRGADQLGPTMTRRTAPRRRGRRVTRIPRADPAGPHREQRLMAGRIRVAAGGHRRVTGPTARRPAAHPRARPTPARVVLPFPMDNGPRRDTARLRRRIPPCRQREPGPGTHRYATRSRGRAPTPRTAAAAPAGRIRTPPLLAHRVPTAVRRAEGRCTTEARLPVPHRIPP